jgi:hypothetical protein
MECKGAEIGECRLLPAETVHDGGFGHVNASSHALRLSKSNNEIALSRLVIAGQLHRKAAIVSRAFGSVQVAESAQLGRRHGRIPHCRP